MNYSKETKPSIINILIIIILLVLIVFSLLNIYKNHKLQDNVTVYEPSGLFSYSSKSPRCEDPKGLAVFNSMKNHPSEWTYDSFNFTNNPKDVSITGSDIHYPSLNFTSPSCLKDIQTVAKRIEQRDQIAEDQDIINKLK